MESLGDTSLAETFELYFDTGVPEPGDDGYVGIRGRIALGAWCESIYSNAAVWRSRDYEGQWWNSAAAGLTSGRPFALFTDINFRRNAGAWVFLADNGRRRVHEVIFPRGDILWNGRFASVKPSALDEVAADAGNSLTWFVSDSALQAWHAQLSKDR